MNINKPPADIWEMLQRLLLCNKMQLAKRLGVTPKTLHRWREETAENKRTEGRAAEVAAKLLLAIMSVTEADELLRQFTKLK